jgi:copper resistance protein C
MRARGIISDIIWNVWRETGICSQPCAQTHGSIGLMIPLMLIMETMMMDKRHTHSRVLPALLAMSLTMGVSLAAIALVAQAPTAAAHAKYESSVPAADSTVTEAPTFVTIHFAETLNPAGSDVIVYDTTGKVVSTAKAQVDTSNPKTITVPMTGDDAESYLVVWHNVSLDDGDPAIGSFTFNVGKQASQATPTPAAPGSASGASGIPGWVVALVGVLGLVVGGAGTFMLAGRRNRA